MDIGFVGLGRMGLNMTIRLERGGHRVAAFDRGAEAVRHAEENGATGVTSLAARVKALPAPRTIWMMIPAGDPVDQTIAALLPMLAKGDLLVDGGNSNYKDSKRRAAELEKSGVMFCDCGTSGGVWGLANGYCIMIGGADAAIARLKPALDTLAPPEGWLHVGPASSGHYAKMIHNGIEYGMMQALAEGFALLAARTELDIDAARLAETWRHGSVVRSWLLELLVDAFAKDPAMEKIKGWVEDSGEGRWTVLEAIDHNVPAEVLTLSLMARFRSRQGDSFRDRVIAALRNEFGGHAVKAAKS